MNARVIGIAGGLVWGLGWISKTAIMAVQGGPDEGSAWEAAAFFTGLIGAVVAAAAAGVYLTGGKAAGLRALAAVGSVLVAGLVVAAGQRSLMALPGDSWVQEEAFLGISGLVAAVVAIAALLRSATRKERADQIA